MKVVIIEDEPINAEELKSLIHAYDPGIDVLAIIDTIEEAISFFKKHLPDLVFMDIELSDGSAFEIFHEMDISCPVVFTTAYDEYALKAFDQNSIAYLLKPITSEKLEKAFTDYRQMKIALANSMNYRELFNQNLEYKEHFLLKFGNSLFPVSANQILFFHGDENLVYVRDVNHKQYLSSYSLSQLEGMLNPKSFFRINRQYIVNKTAVLSLSPHEKGQVVVHIKSNEALKEIVSRRKTPLLKAWLS